VRQLVELFCLLMFLSLGYPAAKGGVRMWHDALVGFLWWVGIMGALALLISFPVVLIWFIRIGLALGLLYALRLVARSAYHLYIRVPATQPARKSHVMQACHFFDADRRAAAEEAATAMLKGYTIRIALAALVEALRRNVTAEKMLDAVAADCDRTTVLLKELAPALRSRSARARQLERDGLEQLVLFFGRESVEQSLTAAQKEGDGLTLRRLARVVRARAADSERGDVLRRLGFDVPVTAAEEKYAPAQELLLWIFAFIHPFWVYFYFRGSHKQSLVWFLVTGLFGFALCLWAYLRAGQIARALIFGIPSALIGAYGVYARFVMGLSSGWVFLAVFGLLYMTALLSLGPTLQRPGARAQTESGRA